MKWDDVDALDHSGGEGEVSQRNALLGLWLFVVTAGLALLIWWR